MFEVFTTKHEEQRVGVFVDVQNLYYSARNIYNARVNYSALLKETVGSRKLIRAIAYVIRAQMPEEQTFFDALSKAGFEVKAKDLQVFFGGIKKGDWDVGITMDMIKQMTKLDSIVLASGDVDYVPLVEYLKNFGLRV
ncbi:MAG: NYN domain-containing protein, partial [Candidatus Doudnabacteria bacterium]|nr:NYN domain-containing protein [Candidatus Doudnabacteria bacterium]